jgi:hypothetical protein
MDLATHWSGLVREPVASVSTKADLYNNVYDNTGAPNYTYCYDPSKNTYCTTPGVALVYSNWGYQVLGDVLGDIYHYGSAIGHDNDPVWWKEALGTLVNTPLGLSVTTSTGTVPTGATFGYGNINNPPLPLQYSRTHDYEWPSGGLWLNAHGAIIWMNTILENWGSVSGATPEIKAAVADRIRYGWAAYGTQPVTTAEQGLAWVFRDDTITATVGGVNAPVWMMWKNGNGDGYYSNYILVPRHDPYLGNPQMVNGTNVGGYGIAIHTNFGNYGTGTNSTIESGVAEMAQGILNYMGTMPMN